MESGAVPKAMYMRCDESAIDTMLLLPLKMALPFKWASYSVDYLNQVRTCSVCVEESGRVERRVQALHRGRSPPAALARCR